MADNQKLIHQLVASEARRANITYPADAPNDGAPYVRMNNQWKSVVIMEDAPSDGKFYIRCDGAWVDITTLPIFFTEE